MSLARNSIVPSVGPESLLSLGHISFREVCQAPSCGYTQTSAVERGWMEMCEFLPGAGRGSRVSRVCCLHTRATWDEISGIYFQRAEVRSCPFLPGCLQQCCHFLGLGPKAGRGPRLGPPSLNPNPQWPSLCSLCASSTAFHRITES